MTQQMTAPGRHEEKSALAHQWWRDAVIYQIYPRSFADGNGDGMGDLPGVVGHLDYLARLGVDAIWLSPFYTSPQADAGYDVADYRDVDPCFGTLDDFDELLAGAHERGLRVIVDLVPNHTSSAHAWFAEAREAAPGSPARARYVFRDGAGEAGELPPNNWQSIFGGSAWTRINDRADDGQWYLHLFDAGQPDLDWRNPEVVAEFQSILRFWLDRGVDGFRVDVAHGLIKQDGLPDWTAGADQLFGATGSPMWDQDDVHEIYRGWNRVLGEYGGDRILVAEAWVSPAERLSRYVRQDEMQQAFNFEFLMVGWNPLGLRAAIDSSLATNAAVGATTTWVLSNHDVVRHATRLGLADPTSVPNGIGPDDEQPDAALGLARARAATALMLALPGSAYLYEGEELGLPEHTELPAAARQDPTFARTHGEVIGRDGARVPLPWSATAPAYGFSESGRSWLPQPDSFAAFAVDAEDGVPGSTLEFYRSAIALRREHGLGEGALDWRTATADELSFENGDVRVIVNFGAAPRELPEGAIVLLASDDTAVRDGRLQPDRAVWLLQR